MIAVFTQSAGGSGVCVVLTETNKVFPGATLQSFLGSRKESHKVLDPLRNKTKHFSSLLLTFGQVDRPSVKPHAFKVFKFG